jgi:glycosyltransferase involved in cell wall biosynthesis
MKRLQPLGKDFEVSVLICTRNRFEAMLKCVASLVTQTRLPDELVVVDSSDAMGLEAQLRTLLIGVNVPFHYEHSAPGLTLQRNIGAALTHGSVIIFLDDDTVLEEEYVEKIAEVYAEDTEGTVGGAQGSFVLGKTSYWFGIVLRRIFMLPGITGLGRMQASGFPSYFGIPDRVTDVDMICGGNTSYRREVLDQFKWNEAFRGYSYMEDDDYSYRVSREFRLVHTPNARMVHEQSKIARDNVERALRMEVRNHALFFRLNMPKTLWNQMAFVWSEIGCCLLSFRSYGFRGLMLRIKAYVTRRQD